MSSPARRRLAGAGVEILLEDNHVLVVAKPAGLLSQGGPEGAVHLVALLEAYRKESEGKPGRAFVGLVHRLDRNVSGVLVVAKTSKAARRLSAAFRERQAGLRKTYLAWVKGVPAAPRASSTRRLVRRAGVTREAHADVEGGREARLSWTVVGRGAGAARLEVDLLTGRTHQVRAQLALEGHPLVGDAKYGGPPGPRPALHAWRLAFPHPVREEVVVATAPVPPDLVRLDRRLRIRPPVESGHIA